MRLLVTFSVVSLSLASACPTRRNPDYCEVDGECANGTYCDLDTHYCVPDPDAAFPIDASQLPDAPPGDAASVDGATADAGTGGVALESRLALGLAHTCYITDAGTLRCWGQGFYGQLGYGSTANVGDNEPASAAGDVALGGRPVLVTAGQAHSCALLDTGAVKCWGDGADGRLGYANTLDIGDGETPADVGAVDVGGPIVSLSAGARHTCALLEGGRVRCWGRGIDGSLGYGNTANIGDDEAPAIAGDVPIGGTAIQLSAGGNHTCALLDTANVRCWGDPQWGQLGYGNLEPIGDNESPASAGDVDVGGPVIAISAGSDHTCALLATLRVRCWGRGFYGQLGYANTNNIGDDELPISAGDVSVGPDTAQLEASAVKTCVRLSTSGVRCWGYGGDGLGYASTANVGDDEPPTAAGDVVIGAPVQAIARGGRGGHACAILADGDLRCWGRNDNGQLGYGHTNNIGDNETPASAGDVPVF